LGEIMVSLHAHQMEAKRLRMIQPKEGRAPNMMLVEAVVGAAPGGLKVLPPLIVHGADGGYTEEIFRIYECDG
ncbi:MAG: methyltransferase, partial [Selenomonadaceae bacterium]|nr:methyltransferase [Selenomonadaceae bacterium]